MPLESVPLPRVAARRRSGDSIVVIVSAMGHTTDELIRLSSEVSPHHHPREMDMLLTAGERISMALPCHGDPR